MDKTAQKIKNISISKATWILVGIALCAISPIGLILVIIRLFFESKLHEHATDYMFGPGFIGIIFGVFQFCMLVSIPGDLDSTDLLLSVCMSVPSILGGILILIVRSVYIRRDKEINLLKTVIEKGNLTDIQEIAEILDKYLPDIEKLIAFMIDRGHLSGYRLNLESHELTITQPCKYVRCTCRSCGAELQLLRGRDITCSYCGSPVTYD